MPRGDAAPLLAGARAGGGCARRRSWRVSRAGAGALPVDRGPERRASPCGRRPGVACGALRAGSPAVVGRVHDGRLLARRAHGCATTRPRHAVGRDAAPPLSGALPPRRRRQARRRRRGGPLVARHRGPHRPRQDRARRGADRHEHRPAAGGARARHLDRARLRAARPAQRAAPERRRRARATSGSCARWSPGATGVDLFLLVVAADDGVMPQTREHLAVLELLGVPRGRGRAHQGRPRRRRAARARAEPTCASSSRGTPFAAAPVVTVSARDGRGLDDCWPRSRDVAAESRRGPARGARRGCRSTASSR